MSTEETERVETASGVKNHGKTAETGGEEQGGVRGEGFVLRDPGSPGQERGGRSALPPVDFSSFVLSLGQMTLIHLGDLPEPVSGETQRDLAQASHTIDLLDLLAEKTRGNLTDEEAQLFGNLRRELKLKYVQAT